MRSIFIVAVLVVFNVLLFDIGSRFVPYNPVKINLEERLQPPSAKHIFGTDELGRDLFSRVVVGAANTLNVSSMTLFSSFAIGVVIGGIAGFYYKTWLDKAFEWIATMLFSLPFILIIASIMSLLSKNLFNAYLVTTAIIWVSPARIVRINIAKTKKMPFVVAEKSFGMSNIRIFFHSIGPLSVPPAFIFSFKYFPEIVGLEAGLSFLGLGVQPPNPGLGSLIFSSINYMSSAWWYAFFPAFTLFLIIFSVNLSYIMCIDKRKQGYGASSDI